MHQPQRLAAEKRRQRKRKYRWPDKAAGEAYRQRFACLASALPIRNHEYAETGEGKAAEVSRAPAV